ncbi:hypothetical protein BKA66DRAFT_476512 [Pyrenochaeta sp. MPI-SDFR-AT-0127]|nr:hypothetical protein BKA66DRAFT_476512 [Pyrenochaeta sp. MPI-SDFR-AT-0127]
MHNTACHLTGNMQATTYISSPTTVESLTQLARPHMPLRACASAVQLVTPSLFMNLPVELRLIIYKELLSAPNRFVRLTYDLQPVASNLHLYPAILRACRAIYNEALPVLYGSNTFCMHTFPLRQIRKRHKAYIRPSKAALIRRIITFATSYIILDPERIKLYYRNIGIQWDQLSLWAVAMRSRKYYSRKTCEDWLVTVRDTVELEQFGICATCNAWPIWLIRKDSVRQRSKQDISKA